MHNVPSPGPSPGASDRYALRVLRLDPEDVHLVRVLSTSYSGLLTHWVAGRGQYCAGQNLCPRGLHQRPTIWKGYFAAELWDQSTKLWFPCVPELTEGAELDVRGRFQRGQIWRLSKPKKDGSSNPPLIATFHEQVDPALLPRAFDVLPVVASLYHVAAVRLGTDNPMPPKVLAVPSHGAPPAGKDDPEEKSAEQTKQIREMLEAFKRRTNVNGGGK